MMTKPMRLNCLSALLTLLNVRHARSGAQTMGPVLTALALPFGRTYAKSSHFYYLGMSKFPHMTISTEQPVPALQFGWNYLLMNPCGMPNPLRE